MYTVSSVLMNSEPPEHKPVLLQEVLRLVVTDRKGMYFDGTLGDGGYTRAILEKLDSDGRVIAADWDSKAIAFAKQWAPEYGERVSVHHNNFCNIDKILFSHTLDAVHGIVLDLGLSSRQIQDTKRGFSYRADGPLDMRMDTRFSETASEILNKAAEGELKKIFFHYGEERRSSSLAGIIIRERQRRPLKTTFDLVELMKKKWRPKYYTKSASRIFQALRIAVNRELDNLERFLDICWHLLLTGGRIAVISYHSLEDRMVKTAFRRHENSCICPNDIPICQCERVPDAKIVTRKPVRPSEEEITHNPRARSAKLRVAEKI